eukprot:symbB.v1.2.009314.t1/scaffold585.1/size314277/4
MWWKIAEVKEVWLAMVDTIANDEKKTTDEIQRDQLLGEYQTGPAMGRLRKYLLGTACLSALGWILGGTSGGEMSLRDDEDEERKCGTRCIPGLMTDDSNIEMNGYRLFR